MYEEIKKAYETIWGKPSEEISPLLSKEILTDFPEVKILLFPPTRTQNAWIYATLGMSDLASGHHAPEIHLFSHEKNDAIVQAISSMMDYVQEGHLHFGDLFESRGEDSFTCTHLLAAYPFPEGEGFPELYSEDREIEFIWLLPVTDSEIDFMKKHGYDALEEKLFESEADFYDWNRKPVV